MKYSHLLVLAALLLLSAAALMWIQSPSAPVLAQDGEGECVDGLCPDWIVEAWAGSAHADAEAEAFVHWDEEDPAEVPVACAKCHSEGGYLDFLGDDGTAPGVVDNPAPIGTVVTCTVCHNATAVTLDSVVFPSGVEMTGVGPSGRCMECHQGRASMVQVSAAIENAGLDLDEPSDALSFVNIHYFAAAASLFGSEVHGGFEFEGKAYQPRFEHVAAFDTCAECHSPHSLEVRVEACSTCHVEVATADDLRAIRMPGSLRDYDGDGDMTEGIADELEGLQALLYQAIQAYASDVVGTAILYDAHTYPYWFVDTNGNGEADEGEVAFPNSYKAFTPRLLQAAYNFQMYEKDPGAFAHNAKYYVQLLYDSIEVLNEALDSPVELAQAQRDDAGHFDVTAEAFRHWDAEGEVPATCAKCHTAEGLPFLLEHGVMIAFEPSQSLACTTCHASFEDFSVYEVAEVTFPSGAVLSFEGDLASNLCLNCHQGRESTVSVNAAINRAGVGDDEVSPDLTFRNVHYFAAGATVFGSEAQGAYQYDGKEYVGRNLHAPGVDTCAGCHEVHELTVRVDECTICHGEFEDIRDIRLDLGPPTDYDGDGDDLEGVAHEIATMHEALYAAILTYAAETAGTPIVYTPASHPYWFIDTNANGEADPDEINSGNRYASWTPTLLRAAYNYQYIAKDPGAFAHNSDYALQVLYDSLESIGGADAVAGMARP